MLALFFEVTPKPGHDDDYFGIAASLKPWVEQSGGMAFLDRYRSLTRPDTVLSYQHWENEAALSKWRADTRHRAAQKSGRDLHFAEYRLRICEIVAGFTREEAKKGSVPGEPHSSEAAGEPRLIMVVESVGEAFPRGEPFKSVNREDAYASLLHIATRDEAEEILNDAETQYFVTGAFLCSITRDYGMHDRAEAPPDNIESVAPEVPR